MIGDEFFWNVLHPCKDAIAESTDYGSLQTYIAVRVISKVDHVGYENELKFHLFPKERS